MLADQPVITTTDAPQPASKTAKPKLHRSGRPRALDDGKRREICALIAGGCGLRDAARYVRCSVNTIRREAERNTDFGQQLHHSETYAQLSPLRAMQSAVATHWRAAAWMLERAFPERFGRPNAVAFDGRQARELLSEVLGIVRDEMFDLFKTARVEKRIRQMDGELVRVGVHERKAQRVIIHVRGREDECHRGAIARQGMVVVASDGRDGCAVCARIRRPVFDLPPHRDPAKRVRRCVSTGRIPLAG